MAELAHRLVNGNTCNKKYAVSLYVNICFHHAKCLQNCDNIFSSSIVLHQLSYRTVKPKFKILQIEDILKFLKDFQHKYSKAQQS